MAQNFLDYIERINPILPQTPFFRDVSEKAYIINFMPGWIPIFYNFLVGVKERHKDESISLVNFKLVEFKEKYGSIRIWVESDVNISDLVDQLEDDSTHVCMFCSVIESEQSKDTFLREINGWMYTICDSCLENKKYD